MRRGGGESFEAAAGHGAGSGQVGRRGRVDHPAGPLSSPGSGLESGGGRAQELLELRLARGPAIFGYLKSLGEADLGRKAKIPLFKQFMGTDEITLPV